MVQRIFERGGNYRGGNIKYREGNKRLNANLFSRMFKLVGKYKKF